MRARFALASFLFLAGCPSPPPVIEPLPDCEAISEACHGVDPGTGPIHDCHETAHDATMNSECAPIRASCVAMCEAIDGGLPHDHDAGEHEH